MLFSCESCHIAHRKSYTSLFENVIERLSANQRAEETNSVNWYGEESFGFTVEILHHLFRIIVLITEQVAKVQYFLLSILNANIRQVDVFAVKVITVILDEVVSGLNINSG